MAVPRPGYAFGARGVRNGIFDPSLGFAAAVGLRPVAHPGRVCFRPTGLDLGAAPYAAGAHANAQPATDEEAIRQLIRSEGQGLVSQDIAGLMDLWASDAVITDAKHTPDNSADDARWTGRDAIGNATSSWSSPATPSAPARRM